MYLYRLYVISAIPSLIHLDDKKVTEDERIQAKNMYPTPLVEHILKSTRARLPQYFRRITNRVNSYFTDKNTSLPGGNCIL